MIKKKKKKFKILIMGLPGSGKTYLAQRIVKLLNADWFNADKIRGAHNDWDFSNVGIIRQVKRMKKLADNSNEVSSSNSFDNQVLNDARNALISLGYKLKDVNDVISNEYKSKVSDDSLEEIIRKILKKLVK